MEAISVYEIAGVFDHEMPEHDESHGDDSNEDNQDGFIDWIKGLFGK